VANEAIGWLAEQNLVGRRRLLEPRGRIDGVAGDEPLAGRRIAGDHLARVDARAVADGHAPPRLELLVQRRQPLLHLEGGPDRPHRIVFVHAGEAEDGHDRVADVLLDGAAMPLERLAHLVEIPRHHLADRL